MYNKFFFCISYFFLIISFMFEKVYVIQDLVKYFEIIGFLFCLAYILLTFKCEKRKFILIVCIYLIVLFSALISSDKTIFKLFFLLTALRNVKFEEVVKIDFWLRLFAFIIIIILYNLGFTENIITYRENMVRNSYGFGHSNMFAYMILLLNMELVYLQKNNLSIFNLFVAIFSIFLIEFLTNSRTCLLIMILMYIGILFINTKNFKKIIEKKSIQLFLKNIFIICTILSALLMFLYYKGNTIGINANILLSDRLRYILLFMTDYPISLLGNNITFVSTTASKIYNTHSLVLDNAFFFLIIRYGLIIYFVFAILMNKSIKKIIKEKDYMLLLVFCLLIIYGLSENYLIKINYNVFLLYFSYIIFKKRNDKNEAN